MHYYPSALNNGEWPASDSSLFTLEERVSGWCLLNRWMDKSQSRSRAPVCNWALARMPRLSNFRSPWKISVTLIK
jgi:hypothetical protein